MRIATTTFIVCALLSSGRWPATGSRVTAQTELDRIVSRVNNRIITQSDIRQARLLRLVDDTSSDDSTRRALEERTLILSEIARVAPLPPGTDSDLATRRREWEASVGGAGRVPELLKQTSMNEASLDIWLRDDVRIQMHLKRQFGSLPEADRARAVSEWMQRLRQRAGLR